MSYLAPSTSLQSTEKIGQGAIHGKSESHWQSPHTVLIHILDDDSLFNIFYLYRPAIFDGDEDDNTHINGGRKWARERWWYKLAQVCQRWRYLILGSASYLRLSLICTFGTPVADMLAHSPPLPLVIDYDEEDRDITAKDEEGIILALKLRDRVRRVRLGMSAPNLQKLIVAMDEEYPVLEYLIMGPWTEDESTALILPETLQAPHLRHLTLIGFVLPRPRLLTTAISIVTLNLYIFHPSAHIQPNTFLQCISFMPQLETLAIAHVFPVPNHDGERQLMHTPIMIHVTLPNLRWFNFKGASAYLEAVIRRITAPRLEKLFIQFFKQPTFFVPGLLQFISAAENFRFDSAKIEFTMGDVYVEVYPPEEAKMYALAIHVDCWHLDEQVSSLAQIFNLHSKIFSTVEHLTLKQMERSQSSEEQHEVDYAEWRKILRSFSNVKTLHVDDELVKELSLCLQLGDGDGELPLELLPELQELTYSGSGDTGDGFTSFVDARRNADRPVALTRR